MRLPFLGQRTYDGYAATTRRVEEARTYATDALVTPDESASLLRYADRLERGLRQQKIVDGATSLNICVMQVAGTAFFPVMFLGSPAVTVTCAAALMGGLVLHTALAIGGKDRVMKSILKGPDAGKDLMVFAQHTTVMDDRRRLRAEARRQIEQKVQAFGGVLDKVAHPRADAPHVEVDPDSVKIGIVRVPVHKDAKA